MSYVLNLGTYSIKYVGKKQPGLDLDRVIGDFLVSQGLATTTDCCTYTLVGGGAAGPTTVTTLFNPTTNVLTTTVNGVTSTATIALDSDDVFCNEGSQAYKIYQYPLTCQSNVLIYFPLL